MKKKMKYDKIFFGDKDMINLVLASTSKYRRQILDQVFLKHTAIASDFEEKSNNRKDPYNYVKELSMGKAQSVAKKVKNSIIIGMDTVVVANDEIMEKPKSVEEAKRYIKLCSNNFSRVITGITIINQLNGQVINTYSETKVYFKEIPDEEIEFYIQNEPYALNSSGFVIETVMSNFIKRIDGTYNNILGAPVEVIYDYLAKWGYSLKDFQG